MVFNLLHLIYYRREDTFLRVISVHNKANYHVIWVSFSIMAQNSRNFFFIIKQILIGMRKCQRKEKKRNKDISSSTFPQFTFKIKFSGDLHY